MDDDDDGGGGADDLDEVPLLVPTAEIVEVAVATDVEASFWLVFAFVVAEVREPVWGVLGPN